MTSTGEAKTTPASDIEISCHKTIAVTKEIRIHTLSEILFIPSPPNVFPKNLSNKSFILFIIYKFIFFKSMIFFHTPNSNLFYFYKMCIKKGNSISAFSLNHLDYSLIQSKVNFINSISFISSLPS